VSSVSVLKTDMDLCSPVDAVLYISVRVGTIHSKVQIRKTECAQHPKQILQCTRYITEFDKSRLKQETEENGLKARTTQDKKQGTTQKLRVTSAYQTKRGIWNLHHKICLIMIMDAGYPLGKHN